MTAEETKQVFRPKYSISEDDLQLSLKVALPEVAKEDIEVSSESGVIHLQAVRKPAVEEKWSLISTFYAPESYELKINVSDEYEISQSNAKFEKNILHLTIPAKQSKQLSLEVK